MQIQRLSIAVKKLRERLKLSQWGFSVKSGIPIGTLQGWENHGKMPRAKQFIRLLQAAAPFTLQFLADIGIDVSSRPQELPSAALRTEHLSAVPHLASRRSASRKPSPRHRTPRFLFPVPAQMTPEEWNKMVAKEQGESDRRKNNHVENAKHGKS